MAAMTPSRPYFVRAIFDWVVDNNCTPYLSVFAGFPTVEVPLEFVEDDHITLNISPSAVIDFHFDNDAISFKARFSGVSRSLYIPMGAIVGLFAKENGHGMGFPEEPFYIEQAESLLTSSPSGEEESSLSKLNNLSTVEPQKGAVCPESSTENPTEDKVSEKKSKNNVSHLKVIK